VKFLSVYQVPFSLPSSLRSSVSLLI
jgi:hypothetical protein